MDPSITLSECGTLGIATEATMAEMTPSVPRGSSAAYAFQFVDFTPSDDSALNRHKVRSNASRNPRARQERVTKHQKELLRDVSVVQTRQETLRNDNELATWLGKRAIGSILKILSAARADPFDTFSRTLTHFEAFLLDHCTFQFLPFLSDPTGRCSREQHMSLDMSQTASQNRGEARIVCRHTSTDCPLVVQFVALESVMCIPFDNPDDGYSFRRGMATSWVQMAAADTGMLATLLLAACRNLAEDQGPGLYSKTALKYKIQTISSLNRALSREGSMISDVTITQTLALASEAVSGTPSAYKKYS